MKFMIIHGAYGNPEENWIPWLKSELEKSGHEVFVPRFPTPENQNLENWLKVFKDHEKYLDKDTIVIGHSLGPVFLLTIIENKPVKAAFFIAPFVDELNNPDFDNINKTFYRKFDWNKIKQNCKKFFIYSSDNDPYVPLEKGKELAKNLECELKIVKNAGHFNEKAGYKQFPLLLEDIKCVG